YGEDGYQVRKALAAIREDLAADDEMLATNTSVLDGRGLAPDELLAHAAAMPFLAAHRLVIVEGLLRALGEARGGRRKKKAEADDPLEAWRLARARLADPATMPATTTLVLVEGPIPKTNAALAIFAPIALATEYRPLSPGELGGWIKSAARQRTLKLTDGAARSLASVIGSNLWALDNELDKLTAYAGGEAVDEAAVSTLVSAARETKVWDLADAIVAGNQRSALTSMGRLLTAGEAPQLLLFMIARQYRQLILVKDLRERRVPQAELQRLSEVHPARVATVATIAGRYSWAALRQAYGRILDADLSVKRGLMDDESSLQLLVHNLCALAPGGSAPRAAYTRSASG
ncbi:MAG TPA: DNA polymerase III subunit delta, partial [Dehalococcoidia bacterium]|nr:DNA polymerase III subunit delta [Dehalococcoidia bacterium]